MTDREAQEIVRMVEGAWRVDYGPEGRELWRNMLHRHDAELATKAVAQLSERQRERPSISDLRGAILKLRADEAAARLKSLPQTNGFGSKEATSEWVWIWSWARYKREPLDFRPFPQQSGYVDPLNQMTMKEYEELREEWWAAGSPKALHPIPMAKTRR